MHPYRQLQKFPHARAHTHAHAHNKMLNELPRFMNKRVLNVLIACEESQAECIAFRNLGHNAFSCDIQECRKGAHPEWHIKGDVTPLLRGGWQFITQNGEEHKISGWDLIIAHPPCTYICRLSSVQLVKNPDVWRYTKVGWKYVNEERWNKLLAGRSFFLTCLHAEAQFVAVENPIPMSIADLPAPDAFACPSWYGVKYTKKTLYWLKNLPPLIAEAEFSNPRSFVQSSRGKYRSRTFPAMAKAIAKQWSDYILDKF